jgi:hypothetical protein
MSDLQELSSDSYCPNCGGELDGVGRSVAVGDDLNVEGTFEGRNACLLIDGGADPDLQARRTAMSNESVYIFTRDLGALLMIGGLVWGIGHLVRELIGGPGALVVGALVAGFLLYAAGGAALRDGGDDHV